MLFEHEQQALDWYEGEERVLNADFLKTIPWGEVARQALDPAFIPVLLYMRDIENLTGMYFEELRRTPTGRDPIIARFMRRWETEETLHGDLLNRFLNEAGVATPTSWPADTRRQIPRAYRRNQWLIPHLTNRLGEHFTAVHMTWGAITELSVITGYQRLWQLAKHPVLAYILKAVSREEARHAFFYWSVARIRLLKSSFRQKLNRYIIQHFWTPVGEGAKPASVANDIIRALFSDATATELFDQRVNQRIEQLPGLSGLKTMTKRMRSVTDPTFKTSRRFLPTF